jgi:hypothetical protein
MGLIEEIATSFHQIRQYGKSDMAIIQYYFRCFGIHGIAFLIIALNQVIYRYHNVCIVDSIELKTKHKGWRHKLAVNMIHHYTYLNQPLNYQLESCQPTP